MNSLKFLTNKSIFKSSTTCINNNKFNSISNFSTSSKVFNESSSTSSSSSSNDSTASTSTSTANPTKKLEKKFTSTLIDKTMESIRDSPIPISILKSTKKSSIWQETFNTNLQLKTNQSNRTSSNNNNNQDNSGYIKNPETPQRRWESSTPLSFPEPFTTITARSLPVVNMNVALAYRRLNRTLQENNLRREVKRQERFESKSDKRVRLDSERHRRRFKIAVGKSVSMSMRMKDL